MGYDSHKNLNKFPNISLFGLLFQCSHRTNENVSGLGLKSKIT